MKSLLGALPLLAASLLLGGCATYNQIKPPPPQAQPISVRYTADGPSGWSDLPIGVYRVPNTNVIISGHQSGSGWAMLFGVVGVLAADAAQTSSGAKRVKNAEDALKIDLTPQAASISDKRLATGKYGSTFAAAPGADGPALSVTPYTVITFVNDTEVMPWVFLKATLTGAPGRKADWTSRYMAAVGRPQKLAGEGSLTDQDGAPLKALLGQELERAVGAMLDDVANRPARDGRKLVYFETGVPYVRMRFGLPADEIGGDEHSLVAAAKIADANVFAGVMVLDKAVTTWRPAAAEDKIKVLEEGK